MKDIHVILSGLAVAIIITLCTIMYQHGYSNGVIDTLEKYVVEVPDK